MVIPFISGAFKAGVQTLKPGDIVREESTALGLVGDYVVLNAKFFPTTGNTVYKLYIMRTTPRAVGFGINPGDTTCITEDDLFEGKSVQWSIR